MAKKDKPKATLEVVEDSAPGRVSVEYTFSTAAEAYEKWCHLAHEQWPHKHYALILDNETHLYTIALYDESARVCKNEL